MAREVHVIRLTAAWERSEQAGWVRLFGRPSGLGCDHLVYLVVNSPPGEPQLRLNDVQLGPPDRVEAERMAWNITTLLQPRNRLQLCSHVDLGPQPAAGRGPLPYACGEVLLEIIAESDVNNA